MTDIDTQQTLAGDDLDVERIECEMYPICSTPAEYEVETLVYDGTAQVYQKLPVCESCAREITEPDEPKNSDKARELRRNERLVNNDE